MLPRSLKLALLATNLVAFATLIRSIAYDRWITVLASVLLIAGAVAARRGRTWGVGLAFAASVAFPVAWAIGIAPPWFCAVGAVGALPFALTTGAFARFDKHATALLAGIALTLGTLGAVIWKEIAVDVFTAVPLLAPSMDAQHGLAIGALLAVTAVVASRSRLRAAVATTAEHEEESHVRIAQRVDTSSSSDVEVEVEADVVREETKRRAATR